MANKKEVIQYNIPFTGINEDNIVCLFSTLLRAIEIAKLGNHRLETDSIERYNEKVGIKMRNEYPEYYLV